MVQQQNQVPVDINKTLSQIKELITKNNSGIIVLPAKATPDAVAAGTTMYLALTRLGKTITLVSSETPQSDLVGVDKIQTNLATGGNNLVVSFPYTEGSIDKVDYKIEEERFNLIIAPREGHEKLQPKDVQFSYTGGKIDFIIVIDSPNLNALGEIYQKNENKFSGKNIVNIDRHLINNNFGTINMVVKTSSSTSELVYHVIRSLGAELDRDMATNLYMGIATATNAFSSYSVNADTFEAIAHLLRAGAVRRPIPQAIRPGMPSMQPMQNMRPMATPFQQSGFNPYNGQPPSQPQQPRVNSMPPQSAQNMQFNDIPQPIPQPVHQQTQPQRPRNQQQPRPIEDVEVEVNETETDDVNSPENWLKPKMFSGKGGLV
ncbi:hypothetical protein BH09PAT2_BH09PAT2_09750 [soil metagenome]